jgi:hypothetical protein
MEEAAMRFLMYTCMVDPDTREMEALCGTGDWQPAPEDISWHDPLVVGRKKRAEAQYLHVYICEEIALLSENMYMIMRDGPNIKAFLLSAVTANLKSVVKRLKSTWGAILKRVCQVDAISEKVGKFIARAEDFADAGQPGHVRAALKSIAKEEGTLSKLHAEAEKMMGGVPNLVLALEIVRCTLDTYHIKYDVAMGGQGTIGPTEGHRLKPMRRDINTT